MKYTYNLSIIYSQRPKFCSLIFSSIQVNIIASELLFLRKQNTRLYQRHSAEAFISLKLNHVLSFWSGVYAQPSNDLFTC